jgi:ribosomal protein L7/L12
MSTPTLITLALGAASVLLAIFTARRQRQEVSTARPRLPRQEELEDEGASPAVAAHLAQGNKISAIKAYRDETGAGLYDSKVAVDQLASRVRARDFVAAGASERVASVLASGDTIGAIKAYREETGAGLPDAKARIDVLMRA